MRDIVDRLRARQIEYYPMTTGSVPYRGVTTRYDRSPSELQVEAADEIERLREQRADDVALANLMRRIIAASDTYDGPCVVVENRGLLIDGWTDIDADEGELVRRLLDAAGYREGS